MALLDFFKSNKKNKTEIVKTKKPSQDQILFADKALEIINPTLEQYGFIRQKTEIDTYSAMIIFRKDKQYIKIISSTYPQDYPYSYNVILGEGDSDNFYEYDWNSIALWHLKIKINPDSNAHEYSFPIGDKVKYSLTQANEDLLKYGLTFLTGDLTLFYDTRADFNKIRQPYKIYSKDDKGKYQTSDEPKSVEQKKKYSE